MELINFLSHSNSKVSFEKGVTVIYGHNGAGKSSIIDAIKFALFGEKRGASISDLIRRGEQDMSVTLDFTIGEHEYQIQRMMSQGKSGIKSRDAVLTEDGNELARTVSGVDSRVSDIMGIDKDTFLNSVFVEQGEIDALISKTKAEKENTFSKILGLDLLGQFAKDLGQLSRDTESRLMAFSDLHEDMDEIHSGIEDKEARISDLDSRLRIKENEKNNLSSELSRVGSSRTEIQERLAALNSIWDQLQGKKKNFDNLSVRIDRRAKDLTEQRSKFERLSSEVDNDLLGKADAIGEYFSLSDSLPAKKELLKSLEERIHQAESISVEIRNLEQGHNAYIMLERKLSDIRSRREEIENSETEYRKAESRLREVEADIETRNHDLAAKENQLMEKLALKAVDQTSVQEEKRKTEGTRIDIDDRIQAIKGEVGKINLDLKDIAENRNRLSDSSTCPLCLQPLSQDHLVRLRGEYRDKEENLRRKLLELAEKKKSLDGERMNIEKRLEMLSSPDIENISVDTRYLESRKKEKEGLLQSISNLRPSHEAYQTYMADLVDTEKKLKNLTYTYNRYEQFAQTLKSTDLEQISKRQKETSEEIEELEKKLEEMEKALNYRPDPDIRKKIREMREKESVRMRLYNELFALNATQESEKGQIDTLKKEIEELNSRLSEKPALDQKFSEINREYENINSELIRTVQEESTVRAVIETERNQISQLREKLAELERKKASMTNLKKGIEIINKLRGCFDREGIQKAIRKDSAIYITNKVREYSTSFNLDFDDVNINEEMAIEVSQNGNVQSIDMLSGGEKVALAIALRLALATYVMESVKTIVMDEPTTYLDEDRRSNLKDIIQYTFRGDETPVPQMIIVTHHKELGSVADNVYEVSKKPGGSQVTSV